MAPARVMTWLTIGLLGVLLSACSAVPRPTPGELPPLHPAESVLRNDVRYVVDVPDPFERLNRRLYNLNYYVDKYLLLPVVDSYAFLLPDYAEDRVSAFFANLGEVGNFVNNLLQFKLAASAATAGRLVVNSTIGIAGLWDPATTLGLKRHPEDFGQTLGYYGVGHGPYLVLPVLGPMNLRDAGGYAVDLTLQAALGPPAWDINEYAETPLAVAGAIDQRHRQPFRYHASGSPFEYEIVRYFYTKKRELEIAR